jgi:hypothetical protein
LARNSLYNSDQVRRICQQAWLRAQHRLMRGSRQLARVLQTRMDRVIAIWAILTMIVAAFKVFTAPSGVGSLLVGLSMSLPFLALAAAPVLGYRIAARAFARGRAADQPSMRLALYGKWRGAKSDEVRRATIAGPAGFLVSLIVGLLLNVPVRSLEYLAVVPAINPADPRWAHVLVAAMTCDVVLMNFVYMVCFVMALRGFPLFPRILAAAWALDIALQLGIAQVIARTDFPPMLIDSLVGFLDGNIKKVLISAFLWVPYLILSDQVNLVFRHRVRLAA